MDTATEFTSMMYDWLSALQKEIRRGNEEEALYWAFELIERNCFTQCVNRLRVIAYEDIGVANLQSSLLWRNVWRMRGCGMTRKKSIGLWRLRMLS